MKPINKKIIKNTAIAITILVCIVLVINVIFPENSSITEVFSNAFTEHGKQEKRFYPDSTLMSVTYYDEDNKNHGKQLTYFKNGKIDQISFYTHGKKSGEWFGFSRNGELTEIMNFDRNNVPFWNVYLLNRVKFLDISGENYTFKNRDGKVLAKGKYRSGNKTGEWKYYYENGNLKSKGKYINSQKTGKWEEFYSNGNIEWNGWYKNNLRDKTWSYYNKEGEFVFKQHHKKGLRKGKPEYCEKYKHLYKGDGKLKALNYYCENNVGSNRMEDITHLEVISKGMVGSKTVISFEDDVETMFRINSIGIYCIAIKDIEITSDKQYLKIFIEDIKNYY